MLPWLSKLNILPRVMQVRKYENRAAPRTVCGAHASLLSFLITSVPGPPQIPLAPLSASASALPPPPFSFTVTRLHALCCNPAFPRRLLPRPLYPACLTFLKQSHCATPQLRSRASRLLSVCLSLPDVKLPAYPSHFLMLTRYPTPCTERLWAFLQKTLEFDRRTQADTLDPCPSCAHNLQQGFCVAPHQTEGHSARPRSSVSCVLFTVYTAYVSLLVPCQVALLWNSVVFILLNVLSLP